MSVMFRKAVASDLPDVAALYDHIHDGIEQGALTVGWVRGVYPTQATAEEALRRDDLFVGVDDGVIVASASINQVQAKEHDGAPWEYDAADDDVMVLHTLVVEPAMHGRGYAGKLMRFFEDYAREQGCHYTRLDTQIINAGARALYLKNGYREVCVVPCVSNGIEGVQLVLFEKKL